MASSLLQDAMPPPSPDAPASTARFRPYASAKHTVTKGRYITSNDPRGYVPVYEYPLNGQWLMVDSDNGYVLWTGIWKALGNSKADIVKMVESQPELAPQLRRVRGGYLKIQGTWMPYEIALRLARRVAWSIREDLIPLFGPTFPSTCLSPDQPGYGQLVNTTGRRKSRRATTATATVSGSLAAPISSYQAQNTEAAQLESGQAQGSSSQVQGGFSGSSQKDHPGRPLLPSTSATWTVPASGLAVYPIHNSQRDPNLVREHDFPSHSRSPSQYNVHAQPQSSSGAYMHPQSHPQFASHNQAQAQTHMHPGPTYSLPQPPPEHPHPDPRGYGPRQQHHQYQTQHQHQQRYTPYPPTRDTHDTHGHAPGHPQRFLTPPPTLNPNPHPYYSPLAPHSQTHQRPIDSYSPEVLPTGIHPHQHLYGRDHSGSIRLPPISSLGHPQSQPSSQSTQFRSPTYGTGPGGAAASSQYSLPPISSLDSPASGGPDGSSAVLRRLKLDDEHVHALRVGSEMQAHGTPSGRDAFSDPGLRAPSPPGLKRRRSFSAPPFNAYGIGLPSSSIPGNSPHPASLHREAHDTQRSGIYSDQSVLQASMDLTRQGLAMGGSGYSHPYSYSPHQQYRGSGSSRAFADDQRRPPSEGPSRPISSLRSPHSTRKECPTPHPDSEFVQGSTYNSAWSQPTSSRGEPGPSTRKPSRPW